MRSLIIGDMEVAKIHARADGRISKFVGKLFPDRSFIRKVAMKALKSKDGDVFETMAFLEKQGYFSILDDKKVRFKCQVAVEIVLHLLHHRSKSRVIAAPNNCHMVYARRLIGPWFGLDIKDLMEVRSQIIAMQSEGSPLR